MNKEAYEDMVAEVLRNHPAATRTDSWPRSCRPCGASWSRTRGPGTC